MKYEKEKFMKIKPNFFIFHRLKNLTLYFYNPHFLFQNKVKSIK